jgi:DNA-binding transcriptional regulator YbjK
MSQRERREALIDAALRVVARRGLAAATTRAIVTEAGMPLASFHYAFSSRDELIGELVSHVVAHEERALAPVMAAPAAMSLRDALRAGLDGYFRALTADPDRERAMFELTQYAMRTPALAGLAKHQYERYDALASSALQRAAELSGSMWTVDVDKLAATLVAMTDGITIGWLVRRDDAAAAFGMDIVADALARKAKAEAR